MTTSDEEQFPPLVRLMMMQFQSGIFCNFLDRLSGHKHLLPDPNHYGCGLHSTGSGGRLMLHIDASRHPNKKLSQQINCIYYCTPDWQEEWGGDLELWDEDATRCVSSITPKFNRLAIFRVSGKSWHGQPFPLQTPPNIRRNSLALYYYSAEEDTEGRGYSNFVRWKGRLGARQAHRAAPGEGPDPRLCADPGDQRPRQVRPQDGAELQALMGLFSRFAAAPPESPCRKVCRLDMEIRLCLGCWRSPKEIAGWSELSPKGKRAVLEALPAREREHGGGR
uniref:Uncharacterized protein urf31.4 n=1 Tax=Sphingomonas sp. ATCC 53159 TaxID=194870 RepID=B4XEU8_9SPHN|nr:hypothetical protein [Sphingomonas sp. ATCC 53159]